MSSVEISSATVVSYANGLLENGLPTSSAPERFSLARLNLAVEIDSVGYAALCRRALVDDLRYRDSSQRQINIAVIDHVARPYIPQARWSGPEFGLGDFIQHLEAHGLAGSHDTEHGIWQFFAQEQCQGIQTLREAGNIPPWETGFPLRNFLHWGYQAEGMRLVHAGTLSQNGRGVLLVGAGGAGKSGTTLAGVLNGLESVGDDYVAVGLNDRTAEAYPVIKLMKQDRAGLSRLGIDPVERELGVQNWQGKYEFDFTQLVEGARAQSMALCGILIPRISGGSKSHISPAPMREALYGLLPNNLQQLPGGLRQGLSFMTTLVRTLPAYYLDLGPEPREIAQTVSRFLEDPRR